ncbi:MAG: hypothetical protein JJ920_15710 [Roseitalea sp.]|jgi:hypothetical protein|nr:hypothetical protein [Roseitalea sp.]MBO6722356.1 hypothetical protein [Roseitalea sp.]MBO6744359.1 hypothetical protein [Roseitalea sp.]
MAQSDLNWHDDEISLSDIVRKLWSGRGLIVALAAVGLCLGALGAFMQMSRTSQTMEYYVELSGIEKSSYPNGTAFSPQDLIAPAVINRLSATVLPQTESFEIRNALTVTFANPATEAILMNYRERVSGANVTIAELNTLSAELEEQLANSIQQMLRISLDYGALGLSESQARNVVTALPGIWSDVYTTQFRVLDDTVLQGQSIAANAQLDEALGVIEADRTIVAMRVGLEAMSGDNRLASLQTESGQTPEDLANRLESFEAVYLSPIISRQLAADNTLVRFYLNDISREIERLDDALASLNATVEDVKAVIGNRNVGPSGLGAGGEAQTTSSGIQVGNGAIDEIVDLANRASLSGYLTSVFERRHTLVSQRANLQSRLRQINEEPVLSQAFVAAAQSQWTQLIESYNALLSGARVTVRNSSGELYRPALAARDVTSSVGRPLLIYGGMGLLLALFVGMVVALLRPAPRVARAGQTTPLRKEAA